MLTEKDKIEYFKRECRNIHYYTEMILQCNEKLEELAICLKGVSSPSVKEVIYENAGDPYKSNKIYLLMEEEKLIKERVKYISAINHVNGKLMEIHNPIEMAMIKDLLLERKSLDKVAETYHMDRTTVWRNVNKILGAIL